MLVGRGDEMRSVTALVAHRGVTVLTGPAGIGKSTIARAAVESTGRWAEGGCLATLDWVPYLAFRRMLGEDITGAPDAVAATVARSLDRRRSAAILIDDAQWADDATLDVIAELADRFAVVTTVRTGEPRSAEVIDALTCLGGHLVELDPLTEPDARLLVATRYPQMGTDEISAVVSHAAGNPLLLTELPRSNDDTTTLVSALLGRLDDLNVEARRAFERLAVLGRPAAASLLGPRRAVDDLTRSGLAAGDGDGDDHTVAVGHDVLAETLVDMIGPRADATRRQLADLVPPAEGAHLLATAGDRGAARARALDAAASTTDPLERARLLELAIACAPPGTDDLELRAEAAELFCDLSRLTQARTLCAIAESSTACAGNTDRVARGRLLGIAAKAAWLAGDPEDCRRLTDAALADLKGSDTPDEVFVLAGSTIIDTRIALDGRPALQRARDAVTLADRVGAHRGFARIRLASVLFTSGEVGWAELFEEAIDDALGRDDLAAARTATTSLGLALWLTGDAAGAARHLSDDVERGPDHDHDVRWLASHSYAAMTGLLSGSDRDDLVARHRPILDVEPLFRTRSLLVTSVGLALVDSGGAAEADALVRGDVPGSNRSPLDRVLAAWLTAEVAWATGRPADAVDAASVVRGSTVGDRNPAPIQAVLVAGHAARQLGLGDRLGTEPTTAFRAWSGAPLEWRGLRAALDGHHRDAVHCFDAAADAWDGNDVRSATRCRWAAGDEARLAGLDDTVDRLEVAEAAAERWGLVPLADRARASLRRCGRASRAPQRSGSHGLTAREEAVLRLVGDGRSTNEIAATLALSTSTVDSFIRHAVRKLGAANRTAAAVQLALEDSTTQRTTASEVVFTP